MIDVSKIYDEYGAWKEYKRVCDQLQFRDFSVAHNAILSTKICVFKRVLYGNGGKMLTEKEIRKWLDNCKIVYDDLCKLSFDDCDEELFYNAKTVIQTLCFVLGIDFDDYLTPSDVRYVVDDFGTVETGVK